MSALRPFAVSVPLLLLVAPLAHAQEAEPLPPPLPPPPPAQPAAQQPSGEPTAPAAQRPPPQEVRQAPPAYEGEEIPKGPPLGRRGFQMALRTGLSFPLGDYSEGTEMRDVTGAQIPLFVDVGGKPNPHFFIGGYAGLGLGGNDDKGLCADGTCATASVRIGFQVQYHATPHKRANAWVGYGIGYSSLGLSHEPRGGGCTASIRAEGVDWARLSAGVDFRLSRGVGIGPFADLAVGEYFSTSVDACARGPGQPARPVDLVRDGDIDPRAAHYWLTIGPRVVFFP